MPRSCRQHLSATPRRLRAMARRAKRWRRLIRECARAAAFAIAGAPLLRWLCGAGRRSGVDLQSSSLRAKRRHATIPVPRPPANDAAPYRLICRRAILMPRVAIYCCHVERLRAARRKRRCDEAARRTIVFADSAHIAIRASQLACLRRVIFRDHGEMALSAF